MHEAGKHQTPAWSAGIRHSTNHFSVEAPVSQLPISSAVPRSKPSHGFRIGQSVQHARFGEGVIINLEGNGDDARAQVNFGPQGVKWLQLAVARLT